MEAEKLFGEMPQRNVASWNAMLRGLIEPCVGLCEMWIEMLVCVGLYEIWIEMFAQIMLFSFLLIYSIGFDYFHSFAIKSWCLCISSRVFLISFNRLLSLGHHIH